MLVTFVMSLPRAQEALGPRGSTFALTGRLSRLASSLLPASTSKSGTDGLDMRLLKVRKFRRRRTHGAFTTHLSVAFLSDPSTQVTDRYLPANDLILSREPDPLVHPPA